MPQVRQRVIIVGFRNDLNASWSFPEGTFSKNTLDYAKLVDGSYWEEHRIPKTKRPIVSEAKKDTIRRKVDTSEKTERWKTVRDALIGLPDPRIEGVAAGIYNHDFRGGARTYAGHSGSTMDEPSKTIKAVFMAWPYVPALAKVE